MSECECGASQFIQINEGFLLTMVASISAVVVLLLNTCIKSRCTTIKMCGVIIDRDPIPVQDLNSINIDSRLNLNNNL